MEVDNKSLRFQTSSVSERGEELCHFSSGTWSILEPVAWWLLKSPSGVKGSSQVQKASGRHGDLGESHTPERNMEVRCRKAEGQERISQLEQEDPLCLGHARDTRELRHHPAGARVGGCYTQNLHYTHLGPHVTSHPPPVAKMPHKPTATSKTEMRP